MEERDGLGHEMAETVTVSGPPLDEKELVSKARAGDTAAFESLYRAHVGRVHALCLRMTGNKTDAEDLTQEVFVRTWNKLDMFRGESAFSTWLHRLTVNLVLTERRSHRRRTAKITVTDDLTAYESAGRKPDPGLNIDLENAIAALPEGARRVFVLHDVEGYKHQEIASMMGLAVGTSKAQLHRARRLLREELSS